MTDSVEIIKDGIQFSPQCDDYIIHGAINGIEALIERDLSAAQKKGEERIMELEKEVIHLNERIQFWIKKGQEA